MPQTSGLEITWLGHATFFIRTPKGTTILIDPFMEHNPTFPKGYELPETLDLMLLTHAHMDHIADAIPVANKSKPTVVAMVELGEWIASKGVEKVEAMNLGGTFTYNDVAVTMLESKHSSSIQDNGAVLYGGVAAGFVLTIEDAPVLYHAGDTTVFGDMKLIQELYAPEISLLPIGGYYVMGPREAALACRYLGTKVVIPMHWGTFPPLKGRPAQLAEHLRGETIEVKELTPGQTWTV